MTVRASFASSSSAMHISHWTVASMMFSIWAYPAYAFAFDCAVEVQNFNGAVFGQLNWLTHFRLGLFFLRSFDALKFGVHYGGLLQKQPYHQP